MNNTSIKTIITDPNGTQTLVREADNLGKSLKNTGLATAQIRALFGEVRQIQAQWDMGGQNRDKAFRRLILLKPKMAYRARKERGKAVEELTRVLDAAVDEVIAAKQSDRDDYFQRFVEFFEAILAYHKAYGGN